MSCHDGPKRTVRSDAADREGAGAGEVTGLNENQRELAAQLFLAGSPKSQNASLLGGTKGVCLSVLSIWAHPVPQLFGRPFNTNMRTYCVLQSTHQTTSCY